MKFLFSRGSLPTCPTRPETALREEKESMVCNPRENDRSKTSRRESSPNAFPSSSTVSSSSLLLETRRSTIFPVELEKTIGQTCLLLPVALLTENGDHDGVARINTPLFHREKQSVRTHVVHCRRHEYLDTDFQFRSSVFYRIFL